MSVEHAKDSNNSNTGAAKERERMTEVNGPSTSLEQHCIGFKRLFSDHEGETVVYNAKYVCIKQMAVGVILDTVLLCIIAIPALSISIL